MFACPICVSCVLKHPQVCGPFRSLNKCFLCCQTRFSARISHEHIFMIFAVHVFVMQFVPVVFRVDPHVVIVLADCQMSVNPIVDWNTCSVNMSFPILWEALSDLSLYSFRVLERQ